MTVADAVRAPDAHIPGAWRLAADALAAAGCRAVFGLPPDEPGLVDAALRHPALDVRVVGDQRVAACAAAGYALAEREPAVLALDSGPSFANAIVGLLEASSLGAPVVVVTSRIDAALVGRGGFQYLDQRALIAPVAEWSVLVDAPGRLGWALRRAVSRSLNGRSGVTVVEVAKEVVEAPTGGPDEQAGAAPVTRYRSVADAGEVRRAVGTLTAARRPVIVVGGGWKWSGGSTEVAQLAEALSAPVFTTAAGRGAIDEHHPCSFGLAGLYTSPPAERLLDGADAVLLLASRFEETARMGWESWRTAAVVQVDRSPDAFGESAEDVLGLLGDAGPTAAALLAGLRAVGQPCRRGWRRLQEEVRAAQRGGPRAGFERSPVRAGIREAMELLGPVAAIVQENGLHDIWSYDVAVLAVPPGVRVVCPGEQTMMGFGMGAAVGAAVACDRGSVTVLFTGDAAFGLGVGALRAMREHSLGVVVVVFDDGGFGWP
ncbi:MAG TPA: thiamine pyrophosphate-binding protein, partial [Pseudonocardia sp.]|nr:thiamine pyrophosphate-binding protein [Pseudonocardia sp.]